MSMINTRQSTKTFSSAPQDTITKSSGVKNVTPDKDPLPEGKDLGTFLNEVADPNYVDPSKHRKVGNNALDKDAFFKLMLAQIKYQDPTSPMKSDEMAAQLAQFTSLEQLTNINTKLDDLTKAQQPSTQFQALNFIGKSISSDTSKIIRSVGDKNHELRFTLPLEPDKVVVSIKNENGEEVRSYEMSNLKKGENKITWNGLDKQDGSTRAGEYYFEVTATGKSGQKIAAQTTYSGIVTGVNYTSEGPALMVGNQVVKMRDVQKIEDGAVKADQSSKEAQPANLALPTEAKKDETEVEGAKRPVKGNLDQVAMSSAVKNNTQTKAQQIQPGMKR